MAENPEKNKGRQSSKDNGKPETGTDSTDEVESSTIQIPLKIKKEAKLSARRITYTSEFDNVGQSTGEEYFEKSETDEEVRRKSGTQLPGQIYTDEGRLHWDNKMDFLLSLIGHVVGIANVWGFPYFCLLHGGATFLIPYTIILVFCVVPVLYMELIIGQFVQQGVISVWKLCPLFKGIGWCLVLVNYFVTFFYNVILAWALIYISESVGYSDIRWMICNQAWNTPLCVSALDEIEFDDDDGAKTNTSASHSTAGRPYSSKEFFKRKVLKLEVEGEPEYDLSNLGRLDTALAIALLFIYIFLLIFLIAGIRISGKMVWVTATCPYIILGLLLFRGLALPGSSAGLTEFAAPKFTHLTKIDIWIDAAVQVFFSCGAGFGMSLTFASYNRFQYTLLRDCILTVVVDAGTSILSGMVLFTYLGNLAYSTHQDVASVVKIGPEAVFESFPTAIGRLPGSHFFSFIFFLMLFLIGIDSILAALILVTTAISDEYKNWFKVHSRLRPTFIFACVAVSYLISLNCVTQGGIYVFQLLGDTSASVSLLVAVFLQTVAIGYVYGLKELCDATEAMTGRRPGRFFNICWKFITPGILILILAILLYTAITSVSGFEGKPVPTWGYIIGLVINFVPMLAIPIIALRRVYSVSNVSGALKFKLAITPDHEYDQVLATGQTRRTTKEHLFWFEWKEESVVSSVKKSGKNRKSRRVAPASGTSVKNSEPSLEITPSKTDLVPRSQSAKL